MKTPRLFVPILILAATLLGCGALLAQEKTPAAPTVSTGTLSEKAREGNAKALAELRGRAEKGDADAQNSLGGMYRDGRGVAKDEGEAVKWFRKAADQGFAEGQNNLGVMYAKGEGVVKDDAEALKWFRKAANQGDAYGQSNLGAMYATGQGVAKDAVEAYKWFLLSGAQGYELAKKEIPLIERDLTAAQRAEGQKQAREFKKK